MQDYFVPFLFFAAVGLAFFAFWRFISALRSDNAEVRKDAKRKAFVALLVLLIATASMAVTWAVHSEVDLRIGDAGHFASRTGRTIQLHPSDVKFQIPQEWLDWDAQFHGAGLKASGAATLAD